MKPNLPAPPPLADMFGFRCGIFHEDEITQEDLQKYEYACLTDAPGMRGYWELYRRPKADESVPILGTKGQTLPGDHHRYDLEKLL